ncbi:MAG: magnesium transporter [Clostridia bacterium]|nr:magnesium transporter [Clostridia bacterium]
MRYEIQELIEQKKYNEVKSLLEEMSAYDVAEVLSEVDDKEALIIFRLLPKELAADTFVEFDSDRQEAWIKALSDKELSKMLEELFVDDTVDIIEEMPANIVKRILHNCDAETRADINDILKYEKDSAGSIMTTEYISLRPEMTVLEAFRRIKEVGEDKESINICYVTDNKRILVGSVNIRTLLLSDMSDVIKDIMDDNVIFAHTTDDKEYVANLLVNYDLIMIPITDAEKRLVGIVTVDDAIDVLRSETTEDMHLMAAVQPNDNTYLKTSVFTHWRKRIVWLVILMVSGVLTSLVIDSYEALLASVPLLISFIPRLMDTGGNCGAQSSTLIIRGLAVGEIKPKDTGKIIIKESLVALLVGISFALINIPVVWILYGSSVSSSVIWWLCLGFGLTLIIVVWIAKVIGGTLPVLAKMVHLDPAIMASPIITTLVDVIAVLTYFLLVNAVIMPHIV